MAISVDFQAFVDEVIEKNDIVDIVSQYTKLKRVGNRYQGLCPLHHDKNTPSFSVSADKQLFHCFGCGAGGTVIQFVMAKENLDYTDALNLLAERARVPIPDRRTPSERDAQLKLQEKKEKIYKMNSLAGKFFYDNLLNPKYKFALDYFRNRQLTDDTIRHFGLGYAPDSWTSLIDHLKSEGYTENEIFEAGLSVKRDNGTYFDKFRDRVMFPIIDLRGNVVAFGGRILTDKENSPKYLNSPDTPVYNKSQTLFAMNFAKNSSTNGILLMEGYMDVISLHQAGFTNAVASCGTAFTEQQARVIKKYTDKVILCYDSDEAGQKATYRAADILKTAEIKAKVLTITSGKDPDDFIKKEGKDRFQNLIDNSENITSYKIRKLRENYNLDNPDDKVEFVEKAAQIFSEMKNSVEQEIFVKKIAEEFSISPDSIFAQIRNLEYKTKTKENSRLISNQQREINTKNQHITNPEKLKVFNAEKLLLNLLCDKVVFDRVSPTLNPEDFSTDLHRNLAEIIYSTHKKGEKINPTAIVSSFSPELMGRVSEILADDKNVDDRLRAAAMPYKIIKESLNSKTISDKSDESMLEYFKKLKEEKQ